MNVISCGDRHLIMVLRCFSSILIFSICLELTITNGLDEPCLNDIYCLKKSPATPLCVERECHPLKHYLGDCLHNKQCIGDNVVCRDFTCLCPLQWQRIRDKCVAPDTCDVDADCDHKKICKEGKCMEIAIDGWQVVVIMGCGLIGFLLTVFLLTYIRVRRVRLQTPTSSSTEGMVPSMPPQPMFTQRYDLREEDDSLVVTTVPVYDPPPSYFESQEGKY